MTSGSPLDLTMVQINDKSDLTLTFQNILNRDLIVTLPFEDNIYPWDVKIYDFSGTNLISKPVPSVTCTSSQSENQVKAKLRYRNHLVQPGNFVDVLFPLLIILDQPLTIGSYTIRFKLENLIDGSLPIEIN